MNQRAARTDYPIHELLTQRWSPSLFNLEKAVSTADLCSLFEAARWTMSCFNEQPWRYIVAVRESNAALWGKVLSCLTPGNQAWAKRAPVLVLGLVESRFAFNGEKNRSAQHDLGAASAMLTVEATARGLYVHQMAGIDAVRIVEEFELSDTLQPCTAIAIGYRGDAYGVDEKIASRDTQPRERKSIVDFICNSSDLI